MIVSMDLNASPKPEEDEYQELHLEEDNVVDEHLQYTEDPDHGETAVHILRREREERTQRMKRQRPDDRSYGYMPPQHADGYQARRQRPNNELPPGWLDCPSSGQEIDGLIPSKVPLGESFNDCILPGKRYSYRVGSSISSMELTAQVSNGYLFRVEKLKKDVVRNSSYAIDCDRCHCYTRLLNHISIETRWWII